MHEDCTVQALHCLAGTDGFGTDNNAVGFHEILDAVALGEEIRIAGHIKLDVPGTSLFQRLVNDFCHMLGCAHGHCRLDDKNAVARDVLAKILRDFKNGAQIGGTILTCSSIDGTEDKVLVNKALLIITRKREPFVIDITVDHIVQAGLINGYRAIDQPINLLAVTIHTGHVYPKVGKACATHQTHISCSYY